MNNLDRELQELGKALGMSTQDSVEDRGVIKVALKNEHVVFLFIYEEREQILLPRYFSLSDYERLIESKGLLYDQLGGSIIFLLQKRMKDPDKEEPVFDVRSKDQTHMAVTHLFEEILRYAPDLLDGGGLEEGRPVRLLPGPRVIRLIDRTD